MPRETKAYLHQRIDELQAENAELLFERNYWRERAAQAEGEMLNALLELRGFEKPYIDRLEAEIDELHDKLEAAGIKPDVKKED